MSKLYNDFKVQKIDPLGSKLDDLGMTGGVGRMNRLKLREQQSDKLRNACKEINTLKAELREIKGLIGKLVNGS